MPVRRSTGPLVSLRACLACSRTAHGQPVAHRGAPPVSRCAPQPGSLQKLLGFVVPAFLVLLGSAHAQTPPGTVIVNQASVAFVGRSGIERVAVSNEVATVTLAARSPSSIFTIRPTTSAPDFEETLGPSACWNGAAFTPLPDPQILGGIPIDPARAQASMTSIRHHGGEPLFVRIVDADQNFDNALLDYVEVSVSDRDSGDAERIRLTETAADSGIFTGYVPTAMATARRGDCVLQTAVDSQVFAEYVDASDVTDRSVTVVSVDPVSRVFDARTGTPVDGATITLVELATGLPARPLSDDGVTPFPASVVSGGEIVDGAGRTLAFGPGQYRFPVVPPGDYRLDVVAPTGYTAPSQEPETAIQALATAPFAIADASYGLAFAIAGVPLLNADIPVDPAAGTLFVEKRASTDVAAVGDFIEFSVAVSHNGGLESAEALRVIDDLPPGLRYAVGSARLLPDLRPIEPIVSDDGRRLEFALGELLPDSTATLRYVTAVVPGTSAHEVLNVAWASTATDRSNTARAAVRISDDLFQDAAFLAGRVVVGQCTDVDVGEDAGLAGARVYLEDGRFAVADENGRFHFEGLQPGAHVAQLDLESLPAGVEVAACPGDARFAGTAFSRFVDLQRGELGRADFHVGLKAPPSGELAIALEQATDGVRFGYVATLTTTAEIAVENVQLMVMLPEGVDYIDLSAQRVDGSPVPVRRTGQSLTMSVGDMDGAAQQVFQFAAVPSDTLEGPLETRALARFDFAGESRQTPVATTQATAVPATSFSRKYDLKLQFDTLSAMLSADDRASLDDVISDWSGVEGLRIEAVGHTDALRISPRSRSIFADNYALSQARADAVVEYLKTYLQIDPDKITVTGVGPDQPTGDNATADGRSQNRRVEVVMSGLAAGAARQVAVDAAFSGRKAIAVAGPVMPMPTMTVGAGTDEADAVAAEMPEFTLASASPGLAMLWPNVSFAPPIPSTKVVVKHGRDDRVSLYLNGAPVSPLNFEGSELAEDRDLALSRWRGVDLADGPNVLVAEVRHADGGFEQLRQELHFAGPPVRGELLIAESTLVADGRTRPLLAVRFVDRWGQPARQGTVGQFAVEAPYRSWWEIERLRENAIIMTGDRTPTFRVGRNGIAAIELEPTTTAGEVKMRINYSQDYPQELRVWLRPAAREWILVGLAEGTVGYSEIAGAMELANAAGLDDDYYDDGRIAFFAKGRIKGALLTAAFDSDGKREDDLDAFGGVIDPDRYYTLYGDNTEQRFDAPSRERLYLKIEKDAFVAMFGDFETGMTITELSRYSRTLTGFKAEQVGERVSYTAFAADTDQSFIKDELRGDGTSGPFLLSRRPILAGSDKLEIEVRDRFKPDRIVSTKTLRRHFDYDIDYNAGTIYFREPIASRDFNFDPVYIVVDYESRDRAERGVLFGGRAAVGIGEGGSEVGVSLVREGTSGAEGALVGTDLRYRLNESNELRAEYAISDVERPGGGTAEAGAYLVELEHRRGGRQMQAYVRETEPEFGLGQQRATEAGTRRTGVQLRSELSPAWNVDAEAFRQENLHDGATRTVIESAGRYQDRRRIGNAGLRRVEEDVGAGATQSTQAIMGGSWKFFDELLTTRANLETAIAGNAESVDYPTRTLVGVDLALGRKVTVFGERELTDGDNIESSMTRIGVRSNPTDRSQVDTSVSSEITEYGPRNFANLGMNQGWNIGEHWVLDLGFERSQLLTEQPVQRVDERVPLASGNLAGDFTSSFFGFGYRTDDWSITNRFEFRDGAGDMHRALISGFYRERTSGRGFSAELNLLDRSALAGTASFDGRLRLGWARRPADSRWIVFNRADWIASRNRTGDNSSVSKRLINNFNAHFLPSYKQEIALQYAMKYVRSEFDGFTGEGILNLFGFDWRRRLDERFDFGLHGSWYQALEQDVVERGIGADIGFNAAQNLVVNFGYNFSGFEDQDFAQARYTARGPYIRFSLKIDQASLKELLRR
jgi:uncharacterized repeat protein (TIGR01451 family)